jgi:hypothetical protein
MLDLEDTEGSVATSAGWQPDDFSFDAPSVPIFRTVWDSGSDEVEEKSDTEDEEQESSSFVFDDFSFPAPVPSGPGFDAWASFDFKAPSVYDPPSFELESRWLDRRSIADMAEEIVATAPPSMSHRRPAYLREIASFLTSQLVPSIAWKLMLRTATETDGDVMMEAIRFRNFWADSDWRVRRCRSKEVGPKKGWGRAAITFTVDDIPLYWPHAVRIARMLEGRDPEAVVNWAAHERWLEAVDDGSEAYWRFVDFATTVYDPHGPGLVSDAVLDRPTLDYKGPKVVRTYMGLHQGNFSQNPYVETIISTGEPSWRPRFVY